jgi:hypothetical protein
MDGEMPMGRNQLPWNSREAVLCNQCLLGEGIPQHGIEHSEHDLQSEVLQDDQVYRIGRQIPQNDSGSARGSACKKNPQPITQE